MSNGIFLKSSFVERPTELFRMYLEERGVMDALTVALARLEQMEPSCRPAHPIDFIANELLPGVLGTAAHCDDAVRIRVENMRLAVQVDQLKQELAVLNEMVHKREMYAEYAYAGKK